MNYKFAAQNQLRFPTIRGNMAVENLFQMPLKASDNFDLDTVAKTVNTELQGLTTESFIPDIAAKTSPRKKVLEVMLEIVKDVITTKVAENAARTNAAKKRELRGKILEAIETQENKKLSETGLDDLKKQLAELGE